MTKIFKPIHSVSQFESLIHFGETPEGLFWDFKSDLDFNKPVDTAIDLCSFANSYGGSLLIGISEKTNANGLKVAVGINPNIQPEKIKEHLNTSVLNLVRPSITIESSILTVAEKLIICVNVTPAINILGACCSIDRQSYSFPVRTEYGNHFLQFNEIEQRMAASNQRAVYLKLLSILDGKDQCEVTLYPSPLVEMIGRCYIKIVRDTDNEFELGINSRVIRLPYSMIREIWNKSNVGENVCVLLEERIIEREVDKDLDIDHPLDRVANEKSYRDQTGAYNKRGMRSLNKK